MATTTTKTGCSVSLPKRCKPSKAVSKGEKYTPIFGYVQLCKTRKGVELQASDRFIAVRVPLKVHGSTKDLVEGPLPTEAVLELEKGSPTPIDLVATATMVKAGLDTRRVRPTVSEGFKFPDLEQVQPPKPAKSFRVGLDTVLLRKLAQAVGSDAVVLEFDQEHMDKSGYLRAIPVRPLKDPASRAHGLIMPVRVNVR